MSDETINIIATIAACLLSGSIVCFMFLDREAGWYLLALFVTLLWAVRD